MTNAAKGALLGALNTILGILATAGTLSDKTTGLVAIIANAVLGVVIFATRKLSPKWQAVVNEVATDTAKAVEESAPVVEEIVKTTAKKKTTKKTTTATPTEK